MADRLDSIRSTLLSVWRVRLFALVFLLLPFHAACLKGIIEPTRILSTDSSTYLVVAKPPAVACHRSDYIGRKAPDGTPEPPAMVQRIRDQVGRRVNLIHRLDRGASGCLLLAFAGDSRGEDEDGKDGEGGGEDSAERYRDTTRRLIASLADDRAVKTYVALVRGGPFLHGEDLRRRGWFAVDRPIRDARGVEREALTQFRFVAGTDDDCAARASIVLARPRTGRWHQIRRHLNGLSHPILGDSTHGNSRINREWRSKRGLPGQRLCLHLAKMSLPSLENSETAGLEVACEIPDDMMGLLRTWMPTVLEEARIVMEEEGILVPPSFDD